MILYSPSPIIDYQAQLEDKFNLVVRHHRMIQKY